MNITNINLNDKTLTVEIGTDAIWALEAHLKRRIGSCALNGHQVLIEDLIKQYHALDNALETLYPDAS